MFYVYFLLSLKNNKVYIGLTDKDPNLRLEEHNQGSNRWTSLHRPLKLIYYEKYFCKLDAQARERFYKSGFGRQIKYIICQTILKRGVA